MSVGPVEYIAIAFPGSKFSGEIIPAIQELQESGTIRVLDLVIIHKDENGDIEGLDISEASPEEAAVLAAIGVEGTKLLGMDDVEEIGAALDPGSTAALMIWENVWAARFASSLRNADGILIANGRIPADLVDEAMAELATA